MRVVLFPGDPDGQEGTFLSPLFLSFYVIRRVESVEWGLRPRYDPPWSAAGMPPLPRNVSDFGSLDLDVVNPWQAP